MPTIVADGVALNTPTGGGLLSSLDPDYQAQQLALKQARAFQGGVPVDGQGNPDYEAMSKRMMQLGDFANADKVVNTGVQMQGMQLAQRAMNDPLLGGGGAPAASGAPSSAAAGNNGSSATAGGAVDGGPTTYLSRLSQIENGDKDGGTPSAAGAVGRYQFLKSTWDGLAQQFPSLGLTADGRTDPAQQERAIRAFTSSNVSALGRAGFQATPGNLYLAHFAGAGGAIGALQADPRTPVEQVLGNAAVAKNPFLKGKTAGDLIGWANGRMAGVGSSSAGGALPASTMAAAQPAPAAVASAQPAPAQVAGAAPAGDAPVTDSQYQAALHISTMAENMDPRRMSLQQQAMATRATEIVSRYRDQQATPPAPAAGAPAPAPAADTDPVQVAQNGASDAPVSNVHPFGPSGAVPAQPVAAPSVRPAVLAAPVQAAPARPAAVIAQPQAAPAAPSRMIDPTMGGLLRGEWVGNPGGYALALRQRAAAYSANPYTRPMGEQLATMAGNIEKGIEREGLITPAMKDYQVARNQGYTGTAMQFAADQAGEKADAENASRLRSDTDPARVRFAGQRAAAEAEGTAEGQNSPGAIQGRAANAGAVAEAQKAGAALGELPAQYAKMATAAQATNDNIDQMLTAAQGFRMGQGAAVDQSARKLLQSALARLGAKDPALDSATASYEDFGKIAGVLNRNAAQQVGGNKGVQELQLIGSTLPTPEQSPDGFRSVASSLKGTADYQVARMQAAQAWKAPNGPGSGSLNGFEADWSKNVSPSAFWLHRLQVDQPDLFAQTAQKLGQTPQGKALIKKSMESLSFLNSRRLLD